RSGPEKQRRQPRPSARRRRPAPTHESSPRHTGPDPGEALQVAGDEQPLGRRRDGRDPQIGIGQSYAGACQRQTDLAVTLRRPAGEVEDRHAAKQAERPIVERRPSGSAPGLRAAPAAMSPLSLWRWSPMFATPTPPPTPPSVAPSSPDPILQAVGLS